MTLYNIIGSYERYFLDIIRFVANSECHWFSPKGWLISFADTYNFNTLQEDPKFVYARTGFICCSQENSKWSVTPCSFQKESLRKLNKSFGPIDKFSFHHSFRFHFIQIKKATINILSCTKLKKYKENSQYPHIKICMYTHQYVYICACSFKAYKAYEKLKVSILRNLQQTVAICVWSHQTWPNLRCNVAFTSFIWFVST